MFHRTLIRREALPMVVDLMLYGAQVGWKVKLTIYGVQTEATISRLDETWVRFDHDDTAAG